MEERAYGKMEWLFYIIILPLLFTSLILGLVLQFMGYNVTGKLLSVARQTPVISSIVPPDEKTKQERSEVRKLTAELDQVKKDLEQAKQTSEQYAQDLAQKEQQVAQLKQKNEQADKQESDRQAADEYWKTQAKVYSEMSPKNAAGILASLPLVEARAIIGRMTTDVKASVLEKMDPKYAALIESNAGNPNDQKSAQDHYKTTPSVYSLMSPDKAAKILSEMTAQQARMILNGMNVEAKAAILEKMDPVKAAERA
ncbi:hypothetical protein [Effusibacillus consociatus]|uniref:Magnesium transporter MgtE intracellular domain-containing protein n=1 Tax=Effusibacillus consociatus TaxID=1117041 RepID=A0ABV9Q5N0_9BACL